MHFSILLLGLFSVVACIGSDAQVTQIGDAELSATYPVPGINILYPGVYIYTSLTTGKIRIATATATVNASTLGTGSDTTETTREWARSQGLPTDDAGHICANRMGGSGKEPVNIFPQLPAINRGIYRTFEGKIADCIAATNATAKLSWTFTYNNATATRPIGLNYCVQYTLHECTSTCTQFSN